MGSRILSGAKDYYCLGLWLADGYWWSSSIGISSTNTDLIFEFRKFLSRQVPDREIKERIYLPKIGLKRKSISKHVYVNSREFTRFMQGFKQAESLPIPKRFLSAYFAGRIDGDGHVDRKYRCGIRIAYSCKEDAKRDLQLLSLLNDNPASLYHYIKANTWVLYFRKAFLKKVISKYAKYSYKLNTFAP